MRPNVKLTLDPLDVNLLPATGGLNLCYRTRPTSEGQELATTLYLLFRWSVLSLLAVVGVRLFINWLGPSSSSIYALAYYFWCFIFPAFALSAFYFYFRDADYSLPIRLIAVPVGIWAAIHIVASAFPVEAAYFVLFGPTVFVLLRLADRIATHYAAWMSVGPLLSRETRDYWQSLWRSRIRVNWRDLSSQLREAGFRGETRGSVELQAAAAYPLSALLVVMGYAMGAVSLLFVASTGNQLFAGMTAVATFLGVIGAGWIIWNRYAQANRLPVMLILRIAWRALVSWITYNSHETPAPGVVQSPSGHASLRHRQTSWRIAVLALVVLPMAGYFPIVLILTGTGAWLPKETPRIAPVTLHVGAIEEVKKSLNDEQKLYFEYLNDDERDQYLTRLATERAAASAEQQTENRRGTARDHITSTPEAWPLRALEGAFVLDGRSSLALFASLLLCLLFPSIMIIALVMVLAGRLLTILYLAVEAPGAPDQEHQPSWESYTDRLMSSPYAIRTPNGDVLESDHLWLGTSVINDYPILLDRRILAEHAHILGASGSGKTAIGMAPLIAQLIRRKDSSVVVIDLKGDPALFTTAREESRAAGLRFRWFTDQLGKATHVFNPLLQAHRDHLTIYQRTDLLLGAFGLLYGRGYGRDYFSDVQNHLLFRALRYEPDCPNFIRLYELLRNKSLYRDLDKKQLRDAAHIWTIVERLASFPALNAVGAEQYPYSVTGNAIQMSDVFAVPQVYYFYLPAALESVAVAEIARLALYSLLTAGVTHTGPRPQVYVFIDEFQQIVSSNLQIVLRHARSMGIGAILANQTLADLIAPDVNLIPTVSASTRFKQFFSVGDVFHQDIVIKTSGEALYEKLSHALDTEGEPISTRESEAIGPRIRRNDIIDFSNHPERSLIVIDRGSGLTQFGGYSFPICSRFHISEPEYRRRQTAPWPEPSDETIVPTEAYIVPETTVPEDVQRAVDGAGEEGLSDKEITSIEDYLETMKQEYEAEEQARKNAKKGRGTKRKGDESDDEDDDDD